MIDKVSTDVVVITGASAGVGRATALAFARRGARIGLLARGCEGLEAARRDIESLGGTAITVPTDVSDPGAVEQAAEQVECALGPIKIWVNNAMTSVFSPVTKMTAADFQRVTEVTYLGVVYGTLAALRRMLERNQGMIVQVGSALAYRGIPLQAAYCGAKHAIQGFTESVRCELLHDRSPIRISMVQMPALNTPQFSWVKSHLPRSPQPVPPIYQPEVAAAAIVHAAYNYRREWFVGMPTVVAIEGNKVIPGIADEYLGRTGYDAQQGDSPSDPQRPNNLYEPLDDNCDYGPHGSFDSRAHRVSMQVCFDQHRHLIAASMAGGALWAMLQHGKRGLGRGLLIGLAVGSLGALGIGAATQLRLQHAR